MPSLFSCRAIASSPPAASCTGGLRAGFRTPDHRRLRRRNGHEPQRHAGQLGVSLSVLLHAKAHDYAFLRAAAGKEGGRFLRRGRRARQAEPSVQGAGPRRPLRQGCVHVALVHDPGLPRLQHRRGPAPRTPGTRPRRVVGASEDGPRHRRYARNHLRRIPCPQGTPRSRRNGAYPLRSHRHVDDVRPARRGAPAPHGRGPQVRRRAHRPHGHLRRQPRNGSGKRASPSSRNKTTSWRAASCSADKERRSCWICS